VKNIDQLAYWINERQAIYERRLHNVPWPWTSDPILQEYSFCNVFRELDKVTVWVRENWREPYYDHPNLWFAMCIARQINWPETLAELEWPENVDAAYWERMRSALYERKARGDKIYTGAYMINGPKQKDIEANGTNCKIDFTINQVLRPLYEAGDPFKQGVHTIEGITRYLSQFMGWSGFMGYEVASDLRHTRYLNYAPDILTWANPGPGAMRGVKRVYGYGVDENPKHLSKETHFVEAMCEIWEKLVGGGEHTLLSDAVLNHPFEMREVEHSLCELDKYLRVKNGEGRPRAKYHFTS